MFLSGISSALIINISTFMSLTEKYSMSNLQSKTRVVKNWMLNLQSELLSQVEFVSMEISTVIKTTP